MIMMIAATAQFCMPSARAATDLVSSPKTRIVVIEVNDDDKVVLAASAIVSIAKHRFLLNGSQPVLEVTIDTVGNNTLRFYYTEQSSSEKKDLGASISSVSTNPESVASRAVQRSSRGMQGKSSSNSSKTPSLKFPEGVYAHTIEYQVSDSTALDTLFTQAMSVWETSAPKIVNIKLHKK